MSWFGALVVFVLASWMVFFAIASAGIRTGTDPGSEQPQEGCEISAPVRVDMGRKALIAVTGGGLITILVWAMVQMGIFAYLVSASRFVTDT